MHNVENAKEFESLFNSLNKKLYKTDWEFQAGRKFTKLSFKKEIYSGKKILKYGFLAALATISTLGLACLFSERIQDYWHRAIYKNKIKEVSFPNACADEIKTIFAKTIEKDRYAQSYIPLYEDKIDDEQARTIIDSIKKEKAPKHVTFFYSEISDQNLQLILDALNQKQSITDISIDINNDSELMAFSAFIKSCMHLERLGLFIDKSLSLKALSDLIQALKENQTLTRFFLKIPHFPDELVDELSKALEENQQLTKFHLICKDSSSATYARLKQVNEKNPNILMDIEFKRLHDQASNLKLMLEEDTTGDFELTGAELTQIMPNLMYDTIKSLSLENCKIKDLKALEKILETNQTIEHLCLLSNTLTEDESFEIFIRILDRNIGLTSIDLSKVNLGNHGVKIVEALGNHPNLQEVHFNINDIGEDETEAINSLYQTNKNIKIFLK